MKTVVALTSLALICALAAAQTGFPKPPEPAEKNETIARPTAPRQRVDTLQLQREARELSDLASSLPADIDRVNHGLLPKDTIEKLRRIEKLSKHMKSELVP